MTLRFSGAASMKWLAKLSSINKNNIFENTESHWSFKEKDQKGRKYDEFFILVNSICQGLKEKKLTWRLTWEIWVDTRKNFLAVNIIKSLSCYYGSLLYSVILHQIYRSNHIWLVISIILHEKNKIILQIFTENSQQRNLRKYYEVIFSQ